VGSMAPGSEVAIDVIRDRATITVTLGTRPNILEEQEPAISAIDPSQEVIALINDDPAYRDKFEAAKDALLNQYAQTYAQFGLDIGQLLTGPEGRVFELGVEAESLMQIVQLILTKQEAANRGIVISEEEIQVEMDSQYDDFLIGQGWTEADLALYLTEQGRTVESFKEDVMEYIANQMLATAVQAAMVGPIEITDEELNEYFLANKSNYETLERVRASHILVDTEEEAEEILAELNDGADFAELARERSTCPSAASGGDLDWFGREAMVPTFDEAAFGLAVGGISGIVATEFGYHVILLTDREDASSPELADVRDQVREDIEDERRYAAALTWYESMYNSAEIIIHDPLLDAIVQQREDIDAAIAILEQTQIDGTSDDTYLSYVLGTLYESKLTDAIDERTTADSADTADLDAQIETLRAQTLAAYQQALEANPADAATIQGKIAEIIAGEE
ncbi:peptidylprolyl isomerase, partial [Candidatus Bipolaricaulota bacterium]|nr:peptidylprolyl isomerase [Candidatus Bipolaricaulota bacterium]